MTEVKMGDFSITTSELLKAQREKCNWKNTSVQWMLYIGTSDLKDAINSSCTLMCTKTLYQTIPYWEMLLKKCLIYNGTPNAYSPEEFQVCILSIRKNTFLLEKARYRLKVFKMYAQKTEFFVRRDYVSRLLHMELCCKTGNRFVESKCLWVRIREANKEDAAASACYPPLIKNWKWIRLYSTFSIKGPSDPWGL